MTTHFIIRDPNEFRIKLRTKLAVLLDLDVNSDTHLKITANLEKGVFNYAIQESNFRKIVKKWENTAFSQLYVDRMRTIYTNLKLNAELKRQVVSSEIAPQTLAFMTHQEMNPDHWATMIETLMKRNASKFTDNTEASTDMFTCRKCKGKRCTYYEMQTRSADEPATIFVTCLDCKNHWRT